MVSALLCRALDGALDTGVSHAPTQVAVHGGVNVGITGVWRITEKLSSLHDLTGLTVATLRHVMFHPRRL